MTISLDAMQRLLLWRLAVTPEGEFLKDISTSLSASKRKVLIRDGYIREFKRPHPKSGRAAAYLMLEDQGWNWCQEHLRDELKTRSTQTTPILERLLGLLANYLEAQDHTSSLGQFVLQARQPSPNSTPHEPPGGEPIDNRAAPIGDLEKLIRAVCLQLGEGRHNVRIRLVDLRHRIPVGRDELDRTLLEMEREGELTLYALNDPRDIDPADREAVLRTATGSERHILYYGPRHLAGMSHSGQ